MMISAEKNKVLRFEAGISKIQMRWNIDQYEDIIIEQSRGFLGQISQK